MASKLSLSSRLELPSSTSITDSKKLTIPQLGFGVWASPKNKTKASVLEALKVGYRHIDTAQGYNNEAEVVEGVLASGLPRDDVFVTTKIWTVAHPAEKDPAKMLEDTYQKFVQGPMGGGKEAQFRPDLLLIHTATMGNPKRKVIWQVLEKLQAEGRTVSIGVSNYGVKELEELRGYAKTWPPAVNQIELHPWCQQREVVDYCKREHIVVQAYCPIVRNQKADDPTLKGIATKVGKTPNQVLLRYSLQKGWNPLPKSDNPERIRQNADLYGFELDKEDMKALDDLDEGEKGAISQPFPQGGAQG
jgi:diketogulonate reductase-like aldo/keto reductase